MKVYNIQNQPYFLSNPKMAKEPVKYVARQFSSGFYNSEEVRTANILLHEKNWQECAAAKFLMEQEEKLGMLKLKFLSMFTNKIENQKMEYLKRMATLRSELLNEKLAKNTEKLESLINEEVVQEILFNTKTKLKLKFIDKLESNSKKIPTAIMVSGTNTKERVQILDWLKEQSANKCRILEHNCPDDADKTLYLLETETEYAEERFKKTGLRTLIKLDNFENILKNDHDGLKSFLFDISESEKPITLIFEAENPSEIASPYLGNARRIPLKIKMDKILSKE